MADYVFEGKSLHVDMHLADGTEFDETFTYTDNNDVPIDLTGFAAVLEVRNVDTKAVVLTDTEAGTRITLGGSAGTVRTRILLTDVPNLIFPCYEWDLKFNDSFRFLRGYIYRNKLL